MQIDNESAGNKKQEAWVQKPLPIPSFLYLHIFSF